MYDLLRRKSLIFEENARSLLARLVSFTNDSAGVTRAQQCIFETLEKLSYDTVTIDRAGNALGVLWGREKGPTLLLNSHVDTSSSAAFGGGWVDGVLEGPGASDCKAGIVAQLYAGELLGRSLLPLKGNLIFASTVADEHGLGLGLRHLLATTLPSMGVKPDFALLGEPTDLGLYYGHDGWASVDIRLRGPDPFQLTMLTNDIVRFYENLSRRHSHCERLISIHRPRFSDTPDASEASMAVERRLQGEDDAGECLGQIDEDIRRCLQWHNADAITLDIAVQDTTITFHDASKATCKRLVTPWACDPVSPLMDRARHSLNAAGCEVRPGKWNFVNLGRATAGSVLSKEFGVPVLGYGPGPVVQDDTVPERVAIDKIMQCLFGTTVAAHGLIGIPVFGWSYDGP